MTRILMLALLTSAAALSAQTPAPPFEVVSIKRSLALDQGGTIQTLPGGRFVARNIDLRQLITMAYDVPADRVHGLPGWAAEERYSIEARADGRPQRLSLEESRAMLLTMLQERFRLDALTEMRDLPVYALALARADGSLGPQLKRASVDCQDPKARAAAQAAAAGGSPGCAVRMGAGRASGAGRPMPSLVSVLTGAAGRPVMDATGLTGAFDFELEWAPTADAEGVSIFAAVQEQLGLKLENAKAPLKVVIVTRVDRPTDD